MMRIRKLKPEIRLALRIVYQMRKSEDQRSILRDAKKRYTIECFIVVFLIMYTLIGIDRFQLYRESVVRI